jgi:hypothetical protein
VTTEPALKPYVTARAYAAVAAAVSQRYWQVRLIAPGRLEDSRARAGVYSAVRAHARRLGVRACTVCTGYGEEAGQPVTVFRVSLESGRTPLTPVLRSAVARAYARGGVSQRQLAARYKISQASVHKIVSARRWDGSVSG